MVPDGQTDGMDGRTHDAKTISLRLRRGIISIEANSVDPEQTAPILIWSHTFAIEAS